MTNSPLAIVVKNLHFQWKPNAPTLDIPQLELKSGSHTFLKGASGSGKSTLLSVLTGIITPHSGNIEILGQDFQSLSQPQKDKFRAEHMGIIFQMFNLLPFLSVRDNICLPCEFSTGRKQKATTKFGTIEQAGKHLLDALGMSPEIYWDKPVSELSVGQQQRVAAARALIGAPKIIIADEPTSALDTNNRNNFIELLIQQANENDTTLLFVSHDQALAPNFGNQINLTDINRVSSHGDMA